VALRQWALDAGLGAAGHPTLADRRDRQPVGRVSITAHDGRPLQFHDLMWIGPNGEELDMPSSSRPSSAKAA
jgi:hypothetical protein